MITLKGQEWTYEVTVTAETAEKASQEYEVMRAYLWRRLFPHIPYPKTPENPVSSKVCWNPPDVGMRDLRE